MKKPSFFDNNFQLVLGIFLLNLFIFTERWELELSIPKTFKYVFSFSGILLLVKNVFVKREKSDVPSIIKLCRTILFIQTIYLFADAYFAENVMNKDLSFWQLVFGHRLYLLPYILPLIALYSNYTIEFIIRFYKASLVFVYFSFFVTFLFVIPNLDLFSELIWERQYYLMTLFDLGGPMLILSYAFVPKGRTRLLLILYYIAAMYFAAYYGRRGLLVDYLLQIIVLMLFNLKDVRTRVVYSFVAFFIGLFLYFTADYFLKNLYIFERGFSQDAWDESRGSVLEDFFEDFNTASDWTIGRGANGVLKRTISEDGYGDTIENGYLYCILKGGLVYLIPFLTILLISISLAFTKGKNDIVRAFSTILIIHIIGMISFNIPDTSIKYFTVWFAASVCLNPKIRAMTNDQISYLLNNNSK
jgi:hypothetical protein